MKTNNYKKGKEAQRPEYVENLALALGKTPPQAPDLEQAVLGALMLDKDMASTVFEILKPDHFYVEAHKKIYLAMVALYRDMQPIDVLTVKDILSKSRELDQVGGPAFLAQMTGRVASAAHAEFHARIIAQKYIQRELIHIAADVEKRAFDEEEDVDDLLNDSQQQLFELSEGSVRRDIMRVDLVAKEAISQMKIAATREDGLSGVPSGFSQIDRVTSGWQMSDLVIIAARPSMGKTAFVLSMARNMAVEHKVGVAVFSLEMSNVQLVNRLLLSETELSADKIRTGKLTTDEWDMLDVKIKDLLKAPIFIDDTPAISIMELRAKCRRLVKQEDVKLIVIDYLQLMTGHESKQGTREQEVSGISRALKALAKDLSVPIIALSQLNRSVETRTGGRPHLSDLRESGAIEQDADIVIFIHRPERYGQTEDKDGNSTKGMAEIIIAKHRNGAVCDVTLKFETEYARFSDGDFFYQDVDGDNGTVVVQSRMNNGKSGPEYKLESNTSFDQQQEKPF